MLSDIGKSIFLSWFSELQWRLAAVLESPSCGHDMFVGCPPKDAIILWLSSMWLLLLMRMICYCVPDAQVIQ